MDEKKEAYSGKEAEVLPRKPVQQIVVDSKPHGIKAASMHEMDSAASTKHKVISRNFSF